MVITVKQKKWVFIFLLLALLILAIAMLRPYLSALFVGGLIAYFIHPLYEKILRKVKSRFFAQLLLSLGSVIILVGLLALLVLPLVSQAQSLHANYSDHLDGFTTYLDQCTSSLCSLIEKGYSSLNLEHLLEQGKERLEGSSSNIMRGIGSVLSGMFTFFMFIVLVVFSIFYFLEHGKDIRENIVNSLPLEKQAKHKIFERLKETMRAVVGGNISTAVLQGIAGGLIFFILGIPASIVWGFVMTIFAFIPAVGPAVIWIPAAIVLFATGNVVKGIILVAFCVVVLGYIDNILKPKLIGKKLKLSSFAVFLGVLGGLQLFGILGLFFGPIILALLVTTLHIYKEMSG